MARLWTTLFATLIPACLASPAPHHLEVASPYSTEVRLESRDIQDVLNTIPDWAANHLMPGSQDIPSTNEIKDKFLLNDNDIDALPVQLLNIPTYANWTGQNWNLRIHGATYKQPRPSNESLDDYAKVFISDDIPQSSFNQSMRDQSRNLTAALLAIPQGNQSLSFNLVYNDQSIAQFNGPYPTSDVGEFETFVNVQTDAIPSGSGHGGTQAAVFYGDLQGGGAQNGNSSAYFVSQQGVTVVADIDDILRVTKIYIPRVGLDNSFAYEFRVWDNMNEIFDKWQKQDLGLHFHYLTTTPEQGTRTYMDFIYSYYPFGSFDIRPYNFTTVDQTVEIRRVNLIRIFETFPTRQFVLMGDTSNRDIMKQYPEMATMFPNQVQCILLRNVSATDSLMKFPYTTEGFQNLDPNKYFFFRDTDDIRDIDISNGGCRNPNVPQNVTFDWQEVPSVSDLQTILSDSGAFSWRLASTSGSTFAFILLSSVLTALAPFLLL